MNPHVFGVIRGGGKKEAMMIGRKRNLAVIAQVLSSPSNQILFVLLAVIIGTLYTIFLPFEFTQRFSFANWNYLDPYLAAWSTVLGIGMSVVLVLEIYAMRRIRSRQAGTLSGLAFIGSVLPSFLCCTPIIPTLLAFIGLSTVNIYGTTGALQHFFAVNQTAFLSGSALLLALSGWWSARTIARAECLNDQCCDVGTSSNDSSKEVMDTSSMTIKGVNR